MSYFKEGKLHITDTTAHAVKTMMEFLYVGRLSNTMTSDEIAEVGFRLYFKQMLVFFLY